MTKREFFEMAATGTLTEEAAAYAKEALSTMDAAATKRNDKAAEKRSIENAPYFAKLREILTEEPKLTTTIVAQAAMEGLTTPKASALLGQMEKAGEIVKSEMSVKGKGKQKAWALAPTQE